MPDDFLRGLGDAGLFGLNVPEADGGAGVGYSYKVVAWEEAARARVGTGSARVHTDVVTPYFVSYATPEQKQRWLPGIISGETIAAIAMTEPGTGSDLAGITTTAVRDGDHYVLNGAKTFITGGLVSSMVIVVARTGRDENDRRGGLSLLVVENGMEGYSRGRALDKLGIKTSDTAELFFSDVHVPVENLLGEEGKAFGYLGSNLPQERLAIAVGSVAMSQTAIRDTVAYAKERTMFGTNLASMQNTKFVLAGLATKVEAAQLMVDRAVEELEAQRLTAVDAAKVKLFCSEVQAEVVDSCLQLHGGYGYVRDYPIAGMYADARVARIYGGSSEVMKVIIAKSLGL
jgi:acyl-CoA dehydrogenase